MALDNGGFLLFYCVCFLDWANAFGVVLSEVGVRVGAFYKWRSYRGKEEGCWGGILPP